MFFWKKAAKSQSPENRILVGLIARLRDRPMEGKRKGLVSLPVSRDCTAERHRDKRRPAALSPGVSAVGKFRPRLGWDLGRGIRRASPQIWEWWKNHLVSPITKIGLEIFPSETHETFFDTISI